MKSFHSSQLVLVCTCVIIEVGVCPQKLACTPKFEKQGGHVPPNFKMEWACCVTLTSNIMTSMFGLTYRQFACDAYPNTTLKRLSLNADFLRVIR